MSGAACKAAACTSQIHATGGILTDLVMNDKIKNKDDLKFVIKCSENALKELKPIIEMFERDDD